MNFYKQNLERFDKILVKNSMLMVQKKQKEEQINIKEQVKQMINNMH